MEEKFIDSPQKITEHLDFFAEMAPQAPKKFKKMGNLGWEIGVKNLKRGEKGQECQKVVWKKREKT